METKQRNNLVDIIRGIAILMVILGHTISNNNITEYENSIIYKIIWTLQMPLFMIISGYITKYSKKIDNIRSLRCYIAKRTFSYILPWMVWTFIIRNILISGRNITELPELCIYIINHMDSGYWFLFCIWHLCIVWGIANYISVKIASKARIAWTVIMSLLIGGISFIALIVVGGVNFLAVKYSIYYLPFYLLGYVSGHIDYNKINRNFYNAAVLIALIIFAISVCRYNIYFSADTISDICIRYISSLSGCVVVIYITSEFFKGTHSKLNRFLATVGRESIGLYLTHYIYLSIIKNNAAVSLYSMEGCISIMLNYVITIMFTLITVYLIKHIKYADMILFGRKTRK